MSSGLEGVADLDRKLGNLSLVAQGRALRSAIRAGIRPAERRWKATIVRGSKAHRTYRGRLVGPGFSSRSIRVITVLSPDKQKAAAVMGLRREAFYGVQFVERSLGKSKGKGLATLRPAMEGTASEQGAAFAAQLKKRIDAVAKGAPGATL